MNSYMNKPHRKFVIIDDEIDYIQKGANDYEEDIIENILSRECCLVCCSINSKGSFTDFRVYDNKAIENITEDTWIPEIHGYCCAPHSSIQSSRDTVLDTNLITEIIGTLTITEGFVPTAIRSEVMRLRERLDKELRQSKVGEQGISIQCKVKKFDPGYEPCFSCPAVEVCPFELHQTKAGAS